MPAVSERQRRAMWAAANGKSILGIPRKVGREFVGRDAEFKESDHPRAGNGRFGSGGGVKHATGQGSWLEGLGNKLGGEGATGKSGPTAYKPGKVSFATGAPDDADDTEEHEDIDGEGRPIFYDVSYVTDGDTIHGVVSGAEVENDEGEIVPIESLGPVYAYKAQKQISASVKGNVEDRAETETEGDRWDSLSDEKQAAEIEAQERERDEADRAKTKQIDADVDALLASGWKPEFNSSGTLHSGKTPEALKQYASPKSMDKIRMRLREKGFKPPVRNPAQDAEFNEADHPRDHGKFAKGSGGIKKVDSLEDPEQEGAISNEGFEEYNQRDAAIEEDHHNLELAHAKIAELMAELKKHHSVLGKHLAAAESNLDRLDELAIANSDDTEHVSPIAKAARDLHDNLESALDAYKEDAKGMKRARKEWDS